MKAANGFHFISWPLLSIGDKTTEQTRRLQLQSIILLYLAKHYDVPNDEPVIPIVTKSKRNAGRPMFPLGIAI
jgi:hypothetical protein